MLKLEEKSQTFFCQFLKRLAPKNDEDPSNKFSRIMDMGLMPTTKHERIFAEIVPVSITNHKMTFLKF